MKFYNLILRIIKLLNRIVTILFYTSIVHWHPFNKQWDCEGAHLLNALKWLWIKNTKVGLKLIKLIGLRIHSLDFTHFPKHNGTMVYYPVHWNRALLMSDIWRLSTKVFTLLAPQLSVAFLKLCELIQALPKGYCRHP